LPVILPLVPVAANSAAAAGAAPAAMVWMGLAIAGSLGFHTIGAQDCIAWHSARHRAAQIAHALVPVDQVDAGIEEVGENIWLPAAEDPTGTLPRALASHPQFELDFAGPNDPRPGFNDNSLGSGRILVRRNY
jgi:hypothetical protein